MKPEASVRCNFNENAIAMGMPLCRTNLVVDSDHNAIMRPIKFDILLAEQNKCDSGKESYGDWT